MEEPRANKAGTIAVALLALAALVAAAIMIPTGLRDASVTADGSQVTATTPVRRVPVAQVRAPIEAALKTVRQATPWLCVDIVDGPQSCVDAGYYIPEETGMRGLVMQASATARELNKQLGKLDLVADTADISTAHSFDEERAKQLTSTLEAQSQAISDEYPAYREWLDEQGAWVLPEIVDLTHDASGDDIVASDGSLSYFNSHKGVVHLGAHDWSANGRMIASQPTYIVYQDEYYTYFDQLVAPAHSTVVMEGPGATVWLQTCTTGDDVIVNKYVRVG